MRDFMLHLFFKNKISRTIKFLIYFCLINIFIGVGLSSSKALALEESEAKSKRMPTQSLSQDKTKTTKLKRKSQRAIEENIYILHAGAFSWIESSHLRRYDTLKYRIRSSVYGATLGYQRIIKDESWYSSYYTLGVLMGEAQVSNVSSDIDYFHRGASMLGLEYTSGILFNPQSEKILLGFALPVIARKINFKIPDSSYKFTNEISLLPFLALEMQWHITEDVAFIQKVGAPLLSDGALWMISLDWIL